jgi:hypothetical protein
MGEPENFYDCDPRYVAGVIALARRSTFNETDRRFDWENMALNKATALTEVSAYLSPRERINWNERPFQEVQEKAENLAARVAIYPRMFEGVRLQLEKINYLDRFRMVATDLVQGSLFEDAPSMDEESLRLLNKTKKDRPRMQKFYDEVTENLKRGGDGHWMIDVISQSIEMRDNPYGSGRNDKAVSS